MVAEKWRKNLGVHFFLPHPVENKYITLVLQVDNVLIEASSLIKARSLIQARGLSQVF